VQLDIFGQKGPLIFSFCKLNVKTQFYLVQCCPTLSPFATCGDKRLECGDR
jgi:hypothetical protein